MGDDMLLTAETAHDYLAGKVSVSGCATLTEQAAEILGSSSGGPASTLNLRGLRRLDEHCATKLSQTNARFLELDGLADLTDELAEALSVYKGRLSLDGVLALSDA
jgi:hypothetical protein